MGIEDLLSHPQVWRGQVAGFDGVPAIATGFAALDRYLPGGGWPLTGISEIFVEHYGLGELRVLMPALATLSRLAVEAKQWIVWIAPPFVPYAPALVERGIDLSRILLVHPGGGHWLADSPVSKDVLWAVEQAIRSQSSIATLAWVRKADATALRRLQLGAEACRCWTVLFRPGEAMHQNSPAALRFRVLSGGDRSDIQIDIRKCRGRKPENFWIDAP